MPADESTTRRPRRRRRRRRRRQPSAKGVLGNVRQTGVLRVGMEDDAPPLHFINDRKQEDGFDFRLAGIVAEGLGAKRIQVVEADYEDLPDRLRAGDIDMIMAGYVPDPSIEGVVWSNGYLDFGLCLIVHEGMVSTYRSVKDLAGKRIAIYDDPAAERWVQQNIPNARDQQVLRRRWVVRGGRAGSGRCAHLRLPVRCGGNQGASAGRSSFSTT